jgi:hypothetical protein
LLIASSDERGDIVCAAGLRSARDGFFSESYLFAPVERVLSEAAAWRVERGDVLEVSTLASRAPRATVHFFGDIVDFGLENGFSWSFFTLTYRLRRMVDRLGLTPICLGDADRRRIANYARWGRYYEAEPKVYAVSAAAVMASRLSVGLSIYRQCSREQQGLFHAIAV